MNTAVRTGLSQRNIVFANLELGNLKDIMQKRQNLCIV